MTGPEEDRHLLHVEGPNDEHAIYHVLIRHGFDHQDVPSFGKNEGGKQGVLDAIPIAVRTSTGKSVGFVMDANDSPQDTWKAVTARLRKVGVQTPNEIPEEGFAGESNKYRVRVGVWLMPDNRKTGALEDFLRDLVEEGDPLFTHAKDSALAAKKHGAGYSDGDYWKAVLHTWLAWQEDPGYPYGKAIKARYFGVDSAAAKRFVRWFQHVFRVGVL
ncbi:MAG: hypothetical protein OXL40_08075 [Bacteroidota bacterium]|nr:hypothetical protein [Bacteroidota bacterium]